MSIQRGRGSHHFAQMGLDFGWKLYIYIGLLKEVCGVMARLAC